MIIRKDALDELYAYPKPRDRETAGLVAAFLAYGRVKAILASVRALLARMPSPARKLALTRQLVVRSPPPDHTWLIVRIGPIGPIGRMAWS